MNLKKIGKVFTSKFVATGPSSYKRRIYRAAVSQRLRNTAVHSYNIPTASRSFQKEMQGYKWQTEFEKCVLHFISDTFNNYVITVGTA
jgi:hypothetical protein